MTHGDGHACCKGKNHEHAEEKECCHGKNKDKCDKHANKENCEKKQRCCHRRRQGMHLRINNVQI